MPVYDRGFSFGDGVFETMRVERGCIPLWKYHRERLLKGLAALQIEAPIQRLERSFQLQQQAIARYSPAHGVSKLVVTRGSSAGGYQYPPALEPNIVLTYTNKAMSVAAPEHLYRSAVAVYGDPRVAGIKHLSRLENVLAREEAGCAGYSDAVLSRDHGGLLETTNSNLFFETASGALVTPLLDNAGVNGVMKRFITDVIAPELGIAVVERPVHWQELSGFIAAFKTNAVSGVTPVASIAHQRFQSSELSDVIAARVNQAFAAALPASQQEYFEVE